MPAMRYTLSAADLMSDELRAGLRRRLNEIVGLVVLGLAGLAVAVLVIGFWIWRHRRAADDPAAP